jgi:hypothetical protein
LTRAVDALCKGVQIGGAVLGAQHAAAARYDAPLRAEELRHEPLHVLDCREKALERSVLPGTQRRAAQERGLHSAYDGLEDEEAPNKVGRGGVVVTHLRWAIVSDRA